MSGPDRSERCVLRERLVEAVNATEYQFERNRSGRARDYCRGKLLAMDLDALPPRLLLAFVAEGLSDEDWAAMADVAARTRHEGAEDYFVEDNWQSVPVPWGSRGHCVDEQARELKWAATALRAALSLDPED